MDVIGDHIGRHWQMLADVDVSRNEGLAEFRSRFAIAFRPTEGAEPATINRQKRWQALLVGLARRTARDHWYEVDRRPKEYFRAAADLYLEDGARCSVPEATPESQKPSTDNDARQVKELLATEPLQLEPVGFGQHVNWTSENHRTLSFAVRSKSGPGRICHPLAANWPIRVVVANGR